MKSPTICTTTMFAILVLVPTQVYADTLFEFAIKDSLDIDFQNETLSVKDYDSGITYEWLFINGKQYVSLPQTTDTIHSFDDIDSSEHFTFDSDRVTFTAIAKTLPIGTPLLMCASFDNNNNYTRCENEAVNRNNYAMVEVDMDAGKMVRTGSSQ